MAGKTTPQEIHSPGPRLVLLFKAGPKPGSGFKANYRFETGTSTTLYVLQEKIRTAVWTIPAVNKNTLS
jgi:hypothetical protein